MQFGLGVLLSCVFVPAIILWLIIVLYNAQGVLNKINK